MTTITHCIFTHNFHNFFIFYVNRATAISMGSLGACVGNMLSPFILQLNTQLPWFSLVEYVTIVLKVEMLTKEGYHTKKELSEML